MKLTAWLTLAALFAVPSLVGQNDPLADAPALLLRDPGAALELAEEVLADTDDGSELAIRARLVIAEAQVWLSAPRLAVENLDRAIAEAQLLAARSWEAEARWIKGRALNHLQSYAASRQSIDHAEQIYLELGDDRGLAVVASLRSTRAARKGEFGLAIALAQEALDSGTLEPLHNASLNALSSLAYGHHRSGNLALAQKLYDRLIDRAWQAGDQRRLHFAFCNRAETRWLQGERRPALEDLERAVVGFESARSRLHADTTERARFLAEQVQVYDRAVRYLMDTDQPQAAFEYAERFHGRSFLEMLGTRELELADAPTAEATELGDAIGRLRLQLAQDGLSSAARQELEALEQRYRKLLEERARRNPRLHSLLEPPRSDLGTTQRALAPGEILISYWVSEKRSFAWLISREKLRAVHIPVSADTLGRSLEAYLAPLRDPARASDLALAGDEAAHLAHGRRLYDWLIAPLAPEIAAARRLLLVPDGILHYLPFGSLVRSCSPTEPADPADERAIHQTYRDCRFLGLDKPIAYSASAGIFAQLRERRRQPPRAALLAMAPDTPGADERVALERAGLAPLRFAQREVEAVEELIGGRAVTGRQASEQRLKAEISAFRYVHLATHGLVDDRHPMSSGVLLHESDGEDGLLQAREVLALELSADLVALSACRTGRGRLLRGEGIVGLSRAFLYAGAASVLASQWDVDDRTTPELMAAFYRHLAAGGDRASALQRARRELFEQQGTQRTVFREKVISYAHPRFWSSFILIGVP
ncbi:MAG: CHAT domain-containing protein [Acidobacteriota bacterium]